MPPAEKPDRPAKRARTDAQLAQKRQTDRVKHKLNRAESKTRLENIEKDVSFLRDSIGDLLSQLRHLQPPPSGSVDPVGSQALGGYPPRPGIEMAPSPDAAATVAPFVNTWLENAEHHGRTTPPGVQSTNYFFGRQNSPSLSVSSPSSQQTTLVDCRCGLQHRDQSECLELHSFTVLYESHMALSQSPLLAFSIPRTPTLPNMLLHTMDDSSLTMLIGTTLRQFQVQNIETLCGLYFLIYRLLRWRMYPNPEWYKDVPHLMRPSEVQDTLLHPVCIDFLPWPALRNYLCQNQNKDSRHSVDLYMRSMTLHWPREKDLLCRYSNGSVELNHDFEAIACDIRNWTLGAPWTEAFQHLAAFVH